MKILATIAAAFSLRLLAGGAQNQEILDLLNSRAAGDFARYEQSAAKVAAAAERGAPLQQFIIALCSRDDANPPAAARVPPETRERYFAESRPALESVAARSSNPLVLYLLAVDRKDSQMMLRAAELGNPQAMNRVASAIVSANPLPYPDSASSAELARAFGFFRQAARSGDVNGLYNYGVCLSSGIGTERDPEAAFNAFRTAAESGHVEAMNNLGFCFREGIHVRRNLPMSAYWFRRAAEAGSPVGMLNFGWALKRGEGTDKDVRAGAKYVYKAAKAGDPDAICAWAMMLLSGDGVGKDPASAVAFLEKAAAAGCVPAMRSLQRCYATGEGVDVSMREATLWKMRADAAGGDAVAAEWLAREDAPAKADTQKGNN